MPVLNSRLQSEKKKLAQAYGSAAPFRHVVIPEFFSPEFGKRLLAEFPSFEDQYALNEMGKVGKKATRPRVRELSPTYRELDDFIQTKEFLDVMSEITGIPDLLYDPEYIGGGTHENLEGQALDPHVDFNYHPRTGWHRRLNLIVYLNPEWKEEWGGNFDLHSSPWDPEADEVETVLPLFNQGVIFETNERSWHGFGPIQLPDSRKHDSRKSFAIYLYTEDRPEEETAASHATVYVPENLPEDIEPGQVLSETQHATIVKRFAQHRKMLKFLYEREQEFNSQIDTLQKALADARMAQRMDLQGYAVQTKAPSGLWPDGWATDEVVLEFSATKPVRGVQLEIWVPAELGSAQVLEIAAGDLRHSEEVPAGRRHTLQVPVKADSGDTVELTIRASTAWRPSANGESGDDRMLAYQVLGAQVEH